MAFIRIMQMYELDAIPDGVKICKNCLRVARSENEVHSPPRVWLAWRNTDDGPFHLQVSYSEANRWEQEHYLCGRSI